MKITRMIVKEMGMVRIEMAITSICVGRIVVFIVKNEDISQRIAGPNSKDKTEQTDQKWPIRL